MKLCNLASVVVLLGFGAVVAAKDLPPALVTAAALSPDDKKVILEWVKVRTDKIARNNDPATQHEGRRELLKPLDDPNVSTPFLNEYARILNDELMLLMKAEGLRVRLNAGVVAGRAAEKSQSPALSDLTVALLNDPMPGVVLWGLRAARWVLPPIMRNPLLEKNDKVLPAVEAAMQKHLRNLVAQDAYAVLTLGLFDKPPAPRPDRAMLAKTLPVMHRMLKARLDLYAQRLPMDPTAEREVGRFLPDSNVWGAANAAQKMQTVQLLSDLLSVTAQHLVAAPQRRDELLPALVQTAAALQVIGGHSDVKNPGLEQAAGSLARLINVPANLLEMVDAVQVAIRATPAFSQLKMAPTIKAVASEPETAVTMPGQ